ncbi:MAG: aminotransferase class III-fold pyridoxal phosphate-dependent enzyme [Prolixibacteraceae bacterium]|nr:aminotransferase class III-fold pyridoxal phosphate-dependent enzyme [Prolixibacteraceae bacterium]
MKLFDVYKLLDVTPERAEGCYLWDSRGIKYLDLYGGHAVISIGHTHPHYVEKINGQLAKIGFYSNSVQNPLQHELAEKLMRLSEYDDYHLFLCNSGAEANENAIKLASFTTQRKKFVAFSKGFHGRTSAAVALTDNPTIVAPVNQTSNAIILPFNNLEAVEKAFATEEIAAVLVEGIQGVGGVNVPDTSFLEGLVRLAHKNGALLILDEIQSGYGRSGKFFAHQYANIRPDIITAAKGMGNGFPIGGVLIHPAIKPWYGMLGTTFGGNHLACAAAIAVLEVLEAENLIENAKETGDFMKEQLVKSGRFLVRGCGLMLGLEFNYPVSELRKKLLSDYHIFTGFSGQNTIRLLPPLSLAKGDAMVFIDALQEVLEAFNTYK